MKEKNLRSADDIVLIAENEKELEEILLELEDKSRNILLDMNFTKTKTMCRESDNRKCIKLCLPTDIY